MLMSGQVSLHAYRSSLPGRADVGDTGLESAKLPTKNDNPHVVSKPKKKKRSWKKPTQSRNHPTLNPSFTTSSQTPISTADSSLPKLRMDQIIESPRLSHPGNTASSVRKWDHSLFTNENSTPRLAYRPFKEVLPKNLPPRPRLPAWFPVQHLSAKREKEISEEKDRMARELRQKERKYQEISQEKTNLLTRLENHQKEYDNFDKKYKEQAKLNQVLKAEVKGLKKGNATLTKKVTDLEKRNKNNNAHKKNKGELNRQIEDLKSQNVDLQSEKQLLARTVIEVSESCEELEEIKRRLEERVVKKDHKSEELDKFVRRIRFARSKYHDEIELKNGANSDSSKAQFEELRRASCNIWKTPNLVSTRERKRQDRLLKMEMSRSKIPQKLDWLDYWIRLIDFALKELEDCSVDQLASESSQDDHPVID
ncbi:uncharacterized protein L199_002627 [Kwoniella botswanensis]|uniref:uncharacterized protein n=1 Tax=Kwoniella botswanensis TaxID=1268659 RepID=UPI00315CA37E